MRRFKFNSFGVPFPAEREASEEFRKSKNVFEEIQVVQENHVVCRFKFLSNFIFPRLYIFLAMFINNKKILEFRFAIRCYLRTFAETIYCEEECRTKYQTGKSLKIDLFRFSAMPNLAKTITSLKLYRNKNCYYLAYIRKSRAESSIR